MKRIVIIFILTIMLVIFSFLTPSFANNGVTKYTIKFGQTAEITGNYTSGIGAGMGIGINAAFEKTNKAGGVNGRTLKLISLNDAYEPEKAIANMNKLIDEEKVFAIIGATGTPTSYASAPIACKQNIPFIGPVSGADFLREMDCVVNIRGTYCQEAEMWIKHLTEDLDVKRVAMLYQDDAGGRVGKACVEKALSKRGMELVGEATYKRNNVAVKRAAVKIKKSNPDAIATFATYKAAAVFIKTVRKLGLNVPVMTFSFTSGKDFVKYLGDEYIKNVVVSQVVPSPFDASIPLVKEYQETLKKTNSFLEPNIASLEGYMIGKLAVLALEKIEGKPTREAFLKAFNEISDLGGVKVSYNMPKDNQGMDDVFLTLISSDGSFKQVKTLKSLKLK